MQDSVIYSDQIQCEDEWRLTTMSYITVTNPSVNPPVQPMNVVEAPVRQEVSGDPLPILIEVIVTSQKQICKLKVKMIEQQEERPIYDKSKYSFNNTNIIIFMVRTNLQQLMQLKLQIWQQQKTIWSSRKTKRQYNLNRVVINQEAALHFDELIQNNKNILLQNYCIVTAQEHLTMNLKKLKDNSLLPQFYSLFKTYFDSKLNNKQVFDKYQPSNMNMSSSEFFIYFFYTIYKEKARERVIEYGIIQKISVKKIQTIRQNKFYRLFKDWKSYLQFLFFVYFQASLLSYEDQNNFKAIIQWNILNQTQETVKQMILKLKDHQKCFLPILHVNKINNKLLENEKISFNQYLNLKIKYLQDRLNVEQKQEISQLLLRFIDHASYKAKSCINHENLNLPQFKYKIIALSVANHQLKQEVNAAQLYNKLKSKYRYLQPFGQFLINTLKAYIFPKIPQLLIDKFEITIIALVIKPQIVEENSILLNHFQKERIQQSQIVFIFRIWQQMKQQEYNINVIQFIILKFVAFNPFFNLTFLNKIIEIFQGQMGNVNATSQSKKNIRFFCDKIMTQIKRPDMKAVFAEWMQKLREKQAEGALYETIIIE